MLISRFSGLRSTAPQREAWAPEDFERWLSTPIVAQDKSGLPLWSPCTYPDGATRGAARVESVTAVVLDFDGGADWDEATAPWRSWCGGAHSSWSHRAGWQSLGGYPIGDPEDYQPGGHRLRVVVPLAEACPRDVFPRLWLWAYDRAPACDKQCRDASRIYYVPAVSMARRTTYRWETWHGPLLDWRALTLPEATPKRQRGSSSIVTAKLSPAAMARVELYRLEHDPAAREAWVMSHGGEIVDRPSGRVGHRLRCPGCGQPSLVLVIEYDRKRRAWCEHENSCGYDGYPWR